MEKTLYRNRLVGSMGLSLLFLGIIFYAGDSPQSAAAMFFMVFPGLAGLYFSTKIQNSRIKWLLITVNYFLATFITLAQIYGFIISYLR
jgi:hypothetical protein